LRPGSIYGERFYDGIGETIVNSGPGNSTINGFSDATPSGAHENSSGAVGVCSNRHDRSGAGAEVGPRDTILLGHQQQRGKKHTDNGCSQIFNGYFHIFSCCFSIYERSFATMWVTCR
jgi:hypothetical protein